MTEPPRVTDPLAGILRRAGGAPGRWRRRAALKRAVPGADGRPDRLAHVRRHDPSGESIQAEQAPPRPPVARSDGRSGPPGRSPRPRPRSAPRTRVARPEHAAGRDDVRVATSQVEPADHGAGHRHDLIGEAVDDRARRRVAGHRRRRTRPATARRSATRSIRPVYIAACQRGRRAQARNGPGRPARAASADRGRRVPGPPRPARPSRRRCRRPSHRRSSPSASRRTLTPVRGDARRVDARPADDDDAPAPVRAGAQRAERVVEDERRSAAKPRVAERRGRAPDVGRRVRAGERVDREIGPAPGARPRLTAAATSSASRSIPASRPTAWCDVVGPRTAASSRPSSSTRATSVLEFPPSTARTVLTRARPSARRWRRRPASRR